MEKIVVLPKKEVIEFMKINNPTVTLPRNSFETQILVVGIKNEKIIGIAIIEKGKIFSGEPTLLTIYVKPEHRGKGYGKKLLKEAISYAKAKKKFPYLRIDILSSKVKKMIESLSEKDKKFLKIFDPGASTGFYPLDYFPE